MTVFEVGQPEVKVGQSQAPNETTRLLRDPVSNSQSRPVPGDNYGAPATQQPQKGDEQSALARILHQTARNVIDVAPMESQAVEQQEYHDRARQYSNRLDMALSQPGQQRTYRPALPSAISAPQIVLAAQPISVQDILLITTVTEKASKAIKEVRIHHKEDLVVPFGVP